MSKTSTTSEKTGFIAGIKSGLRAARARKAAEKAAKQERIDRTAEQFLKFVRQNEGAIKAAMRRAEAA